MPAVVPSGPDNPLGSHALRLSLGDVLIHGTNRLFGIGRKGSHGCIRLYRDDMTVLFEMVRKGSKVTIVRQPVKVGGRGKQVYLEVNRNDSIEFNYFDETYRLLKRKDLLQYVVPDKLYGAIAEKSRIPILISE